ncbi:MAG: hypothetical protein ABEH43_05190, partial [Flavobacteriales bacterium]
ENRKEDFLYENEMELEIKLIELLDGSKKLKPKILQDHFKKYDWDEMGRLYDEVLDELMHPY